MSNLSIKSQIEVMRPEFQKALPQHIKLEKFVRAVQTAISTNAKLAEANKTSFFGACIKAAQVGLMVDGQESAIVEYKGNCTFIPMFQGLLKLARNSGEIKNITSDVVYEKDRFKYWVDHGGQHIVHEPNLFEDRGGLIGAYSICVTRDDSMYVAVLNLKEIEAIEKQSKAQNGPWKGPFRNEMIKKSAFRRLFKMIPKSTDIDLLNKAINLDEEISFDEKPEKETKKPLSRLKEKLDIKEKEPIKNEAEDIVETTSEEVFQDEEAPI